MKVMIFNSSSSLDFFFVYLISYEDSVGPFIRYSPPQYQVTFLQYLAECFKNKRDNVKRNIKKPVFHENRFSVFIDLPR